MAIIEGGRQLQNRIQQIERTATNNIEQALVDGALIVEMDAKRGCPVDTGRLRQSITHEEENFGADNPAVEVGTNVEYAKAVEYGTSRQSAQPYLTPAYNNNKQRILRIIAQAIRRGCGL